ncbi:hypothetical protein Cme02nite_38120 [Catellatospora methionotrophica]|uniref:Uncharacterized protein n=1 Tax=Catellatospora methionotrophica TaxID=121620 RepID=A0A8J3LMP7_9ACTN|nr:hypothetical protein [Catellatospora methionotrophica]GIG15480.1 hypothetical protein Cme02nite_38120 [Catellatospora methionotrophica]
MNDIEIRVSVRPDVDPGLAAARRRAQEIGEQIARELAQAGAQAGDAFQQGITRQLEQGGSQGADAVGQVFEGVTNQAQSMADAVGKSLAGIFPALAGLGESTVATGGINLIILALVGLGTAALAAAAALIVLAPAIYLIGGAFGSAATAGVGLASVLGTLLVGLGGVGDAWSAAGQKAGGGGRSAADAAHQVRQATLALADAQRSAVQAQEAVTRARMDEQERLEDLARSVAGARLDEEGAVLAVAQAERRLRDVRRNGGSALDYREAELNLRKAKQTLEEVRDRVGDLSQEQQEADRKGVEGSDRVQDALERQRQAQRQIEQATYALAQAQRGAGGGVNAFDDAMAKLSPNAQAFIRQLLQIKERFDGIKRATQDRLFEGLDRAVQRLADRSFPTLDRILGRTADSLNRIAKGTTEALGDKEFLSNIEAATGSFDKTLDRIGEKTVPKLLDAIGRLARASIPFWDELSDMALGWIEKFSDKIKKADKDGSLKKFFEEAAENLRKVREIGGKVLSILGSIVSILFPASKRESEGWLDGVNTRLGELSDWLKDEENQQKIRDWITDLQNFRDDAVETAKKLGGIIDKVDEWTTSIDKFIKKWSQLPGQLKAQALGGLWNPIKDGFKAALNWVIDKWNGLELSLPSMNWFGQQIGGGSLGTVNIPRLDHGGIAGGLVSVAERSRELISMPGGGQLLALPQGSMVHPNGATERMLGGGGGSPTVVLEASGMRGTFEAAFLQWFLRQVKVRGGGSVQLAFGDGKTR